MDRTTPPLFRLSRGRTPAFAEQPSSPPRALHARRFLSRRVHSRAPLINGETHTRVHDATLERVQRDAASRFTFLVDELFGEACRPLPVARHQDCKGGVVTDPHARTRNLTGALAKRDRGLTSFSSCYVEIHIAQLRKQRMESVCN